MKQFIINVPDDKQSFFEELMRNLDFSIESGGMLNEPVPEWHKEIVLDRMENFSEEEHIPLDMAMKQIKRKQ